MAALGIPAAATTAVVVNEVVDVVQERTVAAEPRTKMTRRGSRGEVGERGGGFAALILRDPRFVIIGFYDYRLHGLSIFNTCSGSSPVRTHPPKFSFFPNSQ